MELDEAIKHCNEKATELDQDAQQWLECNPIGESSARPDKAYEVCREYEACRECAAEHRQLAEWLTDYKRLKALEEQEQPRKPKCPNSHNCGDCVHAQGVWEGFTFRGFRCHKHCR